MGKARMYGMQTRYVPNAKADMRHRKKVYVVYCPHYEKENPWKRINDAFSALCDKKGGAEDGK